MFGEKNIDVSALTPTSVQIIQPKAGNLGSLIGTATSIFDRGLDYALLRLEVPPNQLQHVNCVSGQISGWVQPVNGTRVMKYGAKTGLTHGIVNGRSLSMPHVISVAFDEQMPSSSNRLSAEGDSGSVYLVQNPNNPAELKIIALHTDGVDNGKLAYATLFASIFPSINQKILNT